MKRVVLFFAVATVMFCTEVFAIDSKAIIVSQKNIPMAITGYVRWYIDFTSDKSRDSYLTKLERRRI